MIYNLVQHKADTVQLELEFLARLEPNHNTLQLNYQISGNLENLILAQINQKIKRADKLWQNTCFEAFLKLKDSPEYIELNLSPFSAYNAYLFTGYRQGMQEIKIADINMDSAMLKNQYSFNAEIKFAESYFFESFSMTAILKLQSTKTTHWAITHASKKADFHLPDSFILL